MATFRSILGRVAGWGGLVLILAGGAGVSIGYVGGKDAEARAASAVKVQVRKEAPTATKAASKKSVARKQPSSAQRKVIATSPASPVVVKRWRRTMWAGGGALVVGVAGVAFSLREIRPRAPRTGADELLNETPPF